MEKDDKKVLVHLGLVLVIILGGFIIVEIFSKPSITAKTINPIKKDINCVNVVDTEYKGIENKDSCCKLIQQTLGCALLDGTMSIEYNDQSKTSEPNVGYNANYVCSTRANSKLYFSFNIYEYCELQGYRIDLN